jgi:hypothetical protein
MASEINKQMKLSHLTLLLIVKKWHLGSYETLFCMHLLCNIYKSIFIGNLCIFPLILQRDIVSININIYNISLDFISQHVHGIQRLYPMTTHST